MQVTSELDKYISNVRVHVTRVCLHMRVHFRHTRGIDWFARLDHSRHSVSHACSCTIASCTVEDPSRASIIYRMLSYLPEKSDLRDVLIKLVYYWQNYDIKKILYDTFESKLKKKKKTILRNLNNFHLGHDIFPYTSSASYAHDGSESLADHMRLS